MCEKMCNIARERYNDGDRPDAEAFEANKGMSFQLQLIATQHSEPRPPQAMS
jgi:hypothetical protein